MILNYQRTDTISILRTIEKLHQSNVFRQYLNSSQLLLLKYMLNLPESIKLFIWQNLLSGKLELLVELNIGNDDKNSNDENFAVNTNQQTNDNIDSNPTDDNDVIDLEQLKAQLDGLEFIGNLSLKIRYVVWEHGLLLLGSDNTSNDPSNEESKQKTHHLSEEISILDTEEHSTLSTQPVPVTRTGSDDEDYDDDYDEDYDEVETKVNDKEEANDDTSTETSSPEYHELQNGFIRLHIVLTRDTLQKLILTDQYQIISNFQKIYHLFDNDKETLMRRLKLAENDELLESSKKRTLEEADEDTENPTLSSKPTPDAEIRNKKTKSEIQMDLGVANLSLRHLLKSVQEHKSMLDISDYELKHLIMDVRMNRSKWASDDKIGQEELYDACEKVVLELRNYTEHSTAFLNKVSKREAPNYYQIIKKPMDLNTVLKKLKTYQYRSKQEFVEDIMLIWRNCLTYNSDPKHFLRIHAIAMQKKSQQLIPLIPDITVRDRAEVEKELEDMDIENNNKEEEEAEEVAGSGRKGVQRRGVQKVVDDEEEEQEEEQGEQEQGEQEQGEGDDEEEEELGEKQGKEEHLCADENLSKDEEPIQDVEPTTGFIAEPDSQHDKRETGGDMSDVEEAKEIKKSNDTSSVILEESEVLDQVKMEKGSSGIHQTNVVHNEDDREEDEEEDEDDDDDNSGIMLLERDDDKDDLELSTWKTLTSKARADLCLKRSQLFEGNKINADAEAILKDPSKLKQFELFFKEYREQKEAEFNRQNQEKNSIIKNGFSAVVKMEGDLDISDGASQLKVTDNDINKDTNEIDLEDIPLLPEYNVSNQVPLIAYEGIGNDYLDKEEEIMVKKIMEEGLQMHSNLLTTNQKGLAPKINNNIELIQDIRHICHKISLIRALQNPNKPKTPQIPQLYKTFTVDDRIDIDPVSQLSTHDHSFDENLMNKIMCRNVSKVAMSSGFESTEPVALHMLTEVAGDYLSNLIKTIKLHNETNSNNHRKPLNTLNMTLLENGINRPDDLFSYMENEFGKKTRKLKDLKARLKSFLKDLLRPTLQDISEKNFEDESQSFMTGDFSSEVTGEDFFGFRELGLEREFGELASNVPLQLLTFQFNGKDADIQVKVKRIQPEEFEDVIYKKVTKDNIQSKDFSKLVQPLLQKAANRCSAYYSKLLRSKNADQVPKNHDSSSLPLMEDEEFPKVKGSAKPRLPPTGKLSTNYKKRPASELFILPEEPQKQDTKVLTESSVSNGISDVHPETAELFGSPDNGNGEDFNIAEEPSASSFTLSLPTVADN